eukprot:CAMPEP_0117604240 /NCGR_PEP_ID=MMETSP0784-20121206/78579_1 /TAXON_ID=39447 /ORGANISM="" /LENGTH=218 /DNA_ID=CAMNT_0005407253 /DNA_START=95 /DNA_END=748 /DNA_ORIENTATION=+
MGLGDENIVDPGSVSDTLRCPVCMDVFEDPVFCGGQPCQHVFCRGCVEHALEQSGHCPSCRAEFSVGDLCAWVGRRDARSAHAELCPVARTDAARAEVAERDACIAELLAERDSQIAQLEAHDIGQILAERDRRIAELETRYAEQGVSLDDLLGRLQECGAKIWALENSLEEKDAILLNACARISALEARLPEQDMISPIQELDESADDSITQAVRAA